MTGFANNNLKNPIKPLRPMKIFSALLCLCIWTTCSSQEKAKTNFGEAFAKTWKRHKIYTLRLVEAMPEDNYGYKPVDSTRTFGQMAMHLASANYMFSSIASDQKFPVDRETLKTENKTKEQITEILSASFDYALKAMLNVDDQTLKKTSPWGNPIEQSTTRTFKEIFHVMREHAAHHRGALTVYLRLNGIVPPGFID